MVFKTNSMVCAMDNFEIDSVLSTFEILVDCREHQTKQAIERYEGFDAPYRKATLNYGDYCANVKLPGKGWLYPNSGKISPSCVIERKMNLDELAGCFTRGRGRFQREFERAGKVGAKVYLLVEDASWEGLLYHRYRSRFTTNAFLASLTAWMVRYGLSVIFCRADTSGRMIKEILYRDMKERLQRGEYG